MGKADNLPPSCAVVRTSGSLNFLEPSGPVQACNGNALTFYSTLNNLIALRGSAVSPSHRGALHKRAALYEISNFSRVVTLRSSYKITKSPTSYSACYGTLTQTRTDLLVIAIMKYRG